MHLAIKAEACPIRGWITISPTHALFVLPNFGKGGREGEKEGEKGKGGRDGEEEGEKKKEI